MTICPIALAVGCDTPSKPSRIVSASKNVSGLVFIYFSNQKFGHTYQISCSTKNPLPCQGLEFEDIQK